MVHIGANTAKGCTVGTERIAPSANLVGRGGVAFVEFQLARRGVECLRTLDSSASGDVWAETGIGRISIEVKTTDGGRSWFVRRNQTRSEIFIFVNLSGGYCYILTMNEVSDLMARFADQSAASQKIPERWLRKSDRDAWSKMGLRYADNLPSAPDIGVFHRTIDLQDDVRYRAPSIEKTTGSDGAVKYFVRPARGRPKRAGKHITFEEKVAELNSRTQGN